MSGTPERHSLIIHRGSNALLSQNYHHVMVELTGQEDREGEAFFSNCFGHTVHSMHQAVKEGGSAADQAKSSAYPNVSSLNIHVDDARSDLHFCQVTSSLYLRLQRSTGRESYRQDPLETRPELLV